jgi:hypothetical protein
MQMNPVREPRDEREAPSRELLTADRPTRSPRCCAAIDAGDRAQARSRPPRCPTWSGSEAERGDFDLLDFEDE